ncbi:hypothetical protein ACJ72_00140 [Emergomyces africanus]|uniref:RanBD1 domain-containing protein n=1 Tax=Emergomyces africanus TaxID=1955775 RepID=A0A1B7P8V8_9EURO|nr:hypothetical protein ACJ72_00140 [Emergomyces africanus]
MASEAGQLNGVLNGETGCRAPSATADDPEPCSSALDTVEPTDKDARGPGTGTQEQNHVPPLEPREESDVDSDNPEAPSGTQQQQPTPLQGTRESPSLLPHTTQDQEGQGEHEPQNQHPEHQPGEEKKLTDCKKNVENSFSDADEGSTHLNNNPAPENDVAELSEGTKAQELEKDKLNHPASDKQKKDGAGERPVRQKLKETSIAGVPRPNSPEDNTMASQVASAAGADSLSDASSVDGRGRLRKKRSLGDMNDDDEQDDPPGGTNTDETGHRRKRSRDSKTDDDGSDKQTESQSKSKSIAGDTRNLADNMGAKTVVAHEGRIRTPTEELKNAERDAANRILSPKKKRSRDQFDKDHLKSDSIDEHAGEGAASAETGEALDKSKADSANRTVEGEPEKKRHRDDSQDRSSQVDSDLLSKKILPPNPFSNAAGISPFASMASKPSELTSKDKTENKVQPLTSTSAFASSRLASFASSDKSPFGALGSASASAFKPTPATETTAGKEQPPPLSSSSLSFAASPFAAAAASSPFGAIGGSGAGFRGSGFSNGFAASASKLGGGLKGFAAAPIGGSAIGGSSSKPKIWGAADSELEDQDAGKSGDDGKNAFEGLEQEKGDERFHEQQTETGEEGEITVFSCRGKLYHFDGKEWKERGVGVFKVNVRDPAVNEEEEEEDKESDDDDQGQPRENKAEQDEEEKEEEDKGETDGEGEKESKRKKTARVIMRADGVWRVILNIPIFKGMKAGDPSGGTPKGKQVHFAGFEDGKSVPFLFRTGNDDVAKELYTALQTLQTNL